MDEAEAAQAAGVPISRSAPSAAAATVTMALARHRPRTPEFGDALSPPAIAATLRGWRRRWRMGRLRRHPRMGSGGALPHRTEIKRYESQATLPRARLQRRARVAGRRPRPARRAARRDLHRPERRQVRFARPACRHGRSGHAPKGLGSAAPRRTRRCAGASGMSRRSPCRAGADAYRSRRHQQNSGGPPSAAKQATGWPGTVQPVPGHRASGMQPRGRPVLRPELRRRGQGRQRAQDDMAPHRRAHRGEAEGPRG